MSRIEELEEKVRILEEKIKVMAYSDNGRGDALEERIRALELDVDDEEDDALEAEVKRLGVESENRAAETAILGRAVYEIMEHLGIHDPIQERRFTNAGLKTYQRKTT